MIDQQHIVSSFDRDLEAIQANVMKMGGLVEAAILRAATAFSTYDIELAEKVRADDTSIDELELAINEAAAQLIALRAPTAIDLRIVLSVIKISSNLERIGDYAKNTAKRTAVLLQMSEVENGSAGLKRLAKEVEKMLKAALDSYVRRDVALANEVIERDWDVDQMYNGLFREFVTYMMEDPRNITACMHLHFIAKNIERMGDHVTSIAEQVVYMKTGDMPGTTRKTFDNTSSFKP